MLKPCKDYTSSQDLQRSMLICHSYTKLLNSNKIIPSRTQQCIGMSTNLGSTPGLPKSASDPQSTDLWSKQFKSLIASQSMFFIHAIGVCCSILNNILPIFSWCLVFAANTKSHQDFFPFLLHETAIRMPLMELNQIRFGGCAREDLASAFIHMEI